jgi:hypothetical protein
MCWYRTPRFLLYTGAGRRVRTHGHLSMFTDRETVPYSTVELYAKDEDQRTPTPRHIITSKRQQSLFFALGLDLALITWLYHRASTVLLTRSVTPPPG